VANEADHNVKVDQPTSQPALPFIQQPALQLIYDTAPIGLAFLSPDCRYLRINQRLTEICGISIEGHLGRTVRECVPALAESVEAIVRSIMTTGEPVTGVEVAGQRADQIEDRAWITYWHPVWGPDREIVGINVAAEEITERKRVEAALRASERQFHTLADSIPQLVWMAEADGRIFWVNSYWYDYTGVPAGYGRAHDWQALLAPASRADARRSWAQSLQAGAALEMELSLLGKDGQYRPFLTRAIPLRDATSTVYRWIGTHIDISEQRRREEHIRFIVDELSIGPRICLRSSWRSPTRPRNTRATWGNFKGAFRSGCRHSRIVMICWSRIAGMALRSTISYRRRCGLLPKPARAG
jgi:PAS domain S-box-containing protein